MAHLSAAALSRGDRRQALRLGMAAMALTAAAVHVPVTPKHLTEAPYMGVLFLLLTAACAACAAAVIAVDRALVYAAGGVCCGLAIAGYSLTRMIALPLLADDVGDWSQPLGLAALVSEIAVVVIAGALLKRSRAVSPPAG